MDEQRQGLGIRDQGPAAEGPTLSTSTTTARDPTPNPPATRVSEHPTPETGPDPDTSRLLAQVRHEFGQPLTVIQGFSELIQDGNLSPEEVKEYAAEIFKEATHLAEIVARLRVE